METAAEDLDIVQKVLSGDRNSYARLLRKYQGKVRGFCLNMLLDSGEAEDAAQEIFIKAYKGLGSFKGDSSFSTWLYRIAANHCKNVWRKRSSSREQSWDALLEQDGERIHALFSVSADVAIPAGEAEMIRELLSCLPDKQRVVLILRVMQGLSYEEIARACGCSIDSVKARLRRAREKLTGELRRLMEPVEIETTPR